MHFHSAAWRGEGPYVAGCGSGIWPLQRFKQGRTDQRAGTLIDCIMRRRRLMIGNEFKRSRLALRGSKTSWIKTQVSAALHPGLFSAFPPGTLFMHQGSQGLSECHADGRRTNKMQPLRSAQCQGDKLWSGGWTATRPILHGDRAGNGVPPNWH